MEATIGYKLFRKLILDMVLITASSLRPQKHFVYLEAKGSTLAAYATDGLSEIKRIAPAAVRSEGGVTVQEEYFNEFVMTLPAEDVTLRMDGSILVVTCDTVRGEFRTVDAVPKFNFTPPALSRIAGKEFAKAIASVSEFAGDDESTPWVETILLNGRDKYVMASDKVRLAKHALVINTDIMSVLPTACARAIGQVVAGLGDIDIGFTHNKIFVAAPELELSATLSSALWNFEIFDKMLQIPHLSDIEMDTKEFAVAVTAIAKMSKKAISGTSACDLILKDGSVMLRYVSEVGKREQVAKTGTYTGKDFQVSFNVNLLKDCFAFMPARLKFAICRSSNGSTPLLFDGGDYTIMCSTLKG